MECAAIWLRQKVSLGFVSSHVRVRCHMEAEEAGKTLETMETFCGWTNPAPKIPWNDDFPVNTKKARFEAWFQNGAGLCPSSVGDMCFTWPIFGG